MTVPTLPTAPSRSMSQDDFDAATDAWIAALQNWTDTVNAMAIQTLTGALLNIPSLSVLGTTQVAALTASGLATLNGGAAVTGAISATTSILSSSVTAGIGYATGAGVQKTQLTSKSTGVTADNVCGQIVMNNAALAAGAVVTFTVTNSAVDINDVICLSIATGATAGAYMVQVSAGGAGAFNVTLRNLTAGSLSEAVTLNFAVIKSVIA